VNWVYITVLRNRLFLPAVKCRNRMQAHSMKRSGWLTFSSVVLIITGVMRVIDAIWAFRYHGAIPAWAQPEAAGCSAVT
jgi:hypothetical protein